MKFKQILDEMSKKQSKKIFKKRKETEMKHFGKEKVEQAYKLGDKLKKHKKITNPYALAKWLKYDEFADERKATAKKAAKHRKK